MEGFKLHLSGWEDGQRIEQELQATDRWVIHTADTVRITIPCQQGDISITIKQEPKSLNATRIGVGACVWEGEMLLAAYLASLPRHRFIGARAVELGSGPGLAGMALAQMGANVVVTDKACVLPLMRENLELNGVSRNQRRGHDSGWAEAEELEWGAEGYERQAELLAQDGLDWIVAADCVYIDNEGESPSTPHFIRTCRIMCEASTKQTQGASTRRPTCLVSFELRSQQVKDIFLQEASKAFSKVVRIPPATLPKGCQVDHIELYELVP